MIGKSTAKLVSSMLVLIMLASSVAGCGKTEKKETDEKGSVSTESSGENVYPLKTNVKLKYWVTLPSQVGKSATNLSETPFAKELTKKTGISVEYIHPPANQVKESFNILIASGDLPDIIEYQWYTVPGGPQKAIEDGSIIKLNDAFKKYSPNLTKFYKENPDIDKMSKTDDGSYYMYPWMMKEDETKVSYGTIIRKDWLDELGLSMPTTIAEWETVLKAFKEKKGAEAPMVFPLDTMEFTTGEIIGGFGIKAGYYMQNGKVTYGQIQPQYKEFISTMRKWYAEGLLDKNAATLDDKAVDAKFLSGKAGATFGYIGGTIGRYMTSMKDKEPKFNVVAAPWPAVKKGDKPLFGQMDPPVTATGGAITPACKNVEIAARFLDYGYSEEGRKLFNFGIENESYKMVNGKPVFTDIVLNNPDKLSMQEALGRYQRSSYSGCSIKDIGYIDQYYLMPQQKEAVKVWGNTEAGKALIPKVSFTPEESAEVAKINNNLSTYNKEMTIKFILGKEPMENFDKYTEQVKKFGVDRVLQIYETAIARYNKR